jgi:protein TonB
MSTAVQGPDSEVTRSIRTSIALIGPDAARRSVVAKALATSDARTVQEFPAYPARLSDLPRLMEQRFDIVMLDLDSDQNYALSIVAQIATISKATVMVYSTRNDPSLLMSSMRAGAREFLPIPADAVKEAAQGSEPVAEDPEPTTVNTGFSFEPVASLPPAPPAAAGPRYDSMETATADEPPSSAPLPAEAVQTDSRLPDFEEWDRIHLRALKELDVKGSAPNGRAGSANSQAKSDRELDRTDVWANQPRLLKIAQADPRPAVTPEAQVKPESDSERTQGRVDPAAFLKAPDASVRPSTAPETPSPGKSWLDALEEGKQTNSRPKPAVDLSTIEPIFRSFQPEEEKANSSGTHWVILSVGLGVIACLLWLYFGHPFRQIPRPATAAQGVTAATSPTEGADQVRAAEKAPEANTTIAKPSAMGPAAGSAASASANPVSPGMMDAQLAAPSKISSDMKKPVAAEAPPPAAVSLIAMADGGGVPHAEFGSGAGVKVVPAASAISAGVAEGILIHKTEPVYPKFAKDNRIGGVVVLKAKITKAGTVQDIQVISGPKALGQAAMDAVKNWRYKPYLLDNQPVEVETLIHVNFSLGQH